MITQQYLKSRLRYDLNLGSFTWINGPRKGFLAGNINPRGYHVIELKGKTYRAHRLAWLYVHGEIPPMLDHINRDTSDNRIVNLRPCNSSQNQYNSKDRNRILPRGVIKHRKRYVARIVLQVGTYNTPEEASAAYQKKRKEILGEFAIGL